MDHKPLNKKNQNFLYTQIAEQIINNIENSNLVVGDRIPSEKNIADLYNVSQITAKKAIKYLEEKGIIFREVGKGSFIARPKMHNVAAFKSFTEYIKSLKKNPGSIIINQEIIKPDENLANELQINLDEPVILIERVRTVDDHKIAHQISKIPYSISPDLESLDLQGKSLYEVFNNQYGVNPYWVEATIKAELANQNDSTILDIKIKEPLLVVDGITYTKNFSIIEKVVSKYVGNQLDLYIGRQRIG